MTHPFLDNLLTAINTGAAVAALTVVKATGGYRDALGRRALLWTDRDTITELELADLTATVQADARAALTERRPQMLTYQTDAGTIALFVEVQRRPPTLIVVGAGHVAVPLAHLGKLIDFSVVVIDDRPDYANTQRFPMADQVLAQPFRATLREWPIDADTYIVLVTRGHSHDVDCLLEVLDSPARYIGMIGSKRRVKAVFDLLADEQGIDRSKFDRVYAPIGLDIGAESPAEIAVGIIAEIINLYRGGRAKPLSDALRENRRLPLHPGRK